MITKKEKLNIDELYVKVKKLLNLKYDNIKNNYLTLYSNYGNKELIRDNYLNEIKIKLKDLEIQYKNKYEQIYILFLYENLIDYDSKKLLNHYLEITEDNFDYFLEILPPLKMSNKGFIMSEFLTDNITHRFSSIKGDKYYIDCVRVE